MATIVVFLTVICAWAWYFAVQTMAMRQVRLADSRLTALESSLAVVRTGAVPLVQVLSDHSYPLPQRHVPDSCQPEAKADAHSFFAAGQGSACVSASTGGTPMASPRQAVRSPRGTSSSHHAHRRLTMLLVALVGSAGVLLAAAFELVETYWCWSVPAMLSASVLLLRWDVVRSARRRAKAERAADEARYRRAGTGSIPVVQPRSGAMPVVQPHSGAMPVVQPHSGAMPVVQPRPGAMPRRASTGPIPVVSPRSGAIPVAAPSGAVPVVQTSHGVTSAPPQGDLRGRTDWASQEPYWDIVEDFSQPLYSSPGPSFASGAIPVVPSTSQHVPVGAPSPAATTSAEQVGAYDVDEPITGSMQGIPTDDINTWQPTPVPPPTYAMKAKATPRVAAPLAPDASSVTHDAYDAYAEDIHHAHNGQRRASGQ